MARGVRSFLLVPAGGDGDGMGHLSRCLRIAGQLGAGVSLLSSRLDKASSALLRRGARDSAGRARPEILPGLKPGRRWDVVLVDGRATTISELLQLQKLGPVVCLDEGGEARAFASYLVDALPGLPNRCPANLSSQAFLDLPARSRHKGRGGFQKVLITFGGEDRQNLSRRLLDALLENGIFAPAQITVVEGPLFGPRVWPPATRVLRGVMRLADILPRYDLVFTHFGMTGFEAMACGVPVIQLNPAEYHARLSRAAGIPEIGIGAPDVHALQLFLEDEKGLMRRVEEFNSRLGARRAGRLAEIVRSLHVQGTPRCTVCGHDGNRVVARFSDRTYRACSGCGVLTMESFASHPMRYDAAYFGAEYKAQYGRTYLEDFDSIKSLSRERLRIVRGLAGEKVDGAIVDVGCAFGPFLAAAREDGLACFGIDVSSQAVEHVRKKLGIPALRASFVDVRRSQLPRRVSAVTLWWVIEHFPDADLVLRKASALLPQGGVLALSTPNGRGISARSDLRRFLEKSPADHFTIFSPRGLRRILSAYGLDLKLVRITGHHPERFPGILGRAARASALASRIAGAASRLFGLGDTFEAYAVKGEQA